MSGIVGIHNLNGRPVSCNELREMNSILGHRGPDGSGLWCDGAVGFGHRMLYTTPQSLREVLPLVSRSADLAITADARLDNREELIQLLGLKNQPTGEITDSELILAGYEKWGEMCPVNLLGDFAFAIWDKRKHALFCARDYFGVKPFYYHFSNYVFAFASEIKALLRLPNVPSRINEIRVAYHLQPELLEQDKELTFYQDILRLAPASTMTVTVKGTQRRCYWSLDPDRDLRLKSDDQYSEAFREIFTDSVHCRLRSAFPVGSTLSGGLDSSSITCTARDLLAGRRDDSLHTFSAIFPSLPERDRRKIDERQFVDAVVAMGGLTPHYIRADCLGPLEDMKRVIWHEDEAVMAPNLYMHWGLYKEAQKQGVRVMLDGIDGDTTVSHGLGYLAELTERGRWITLLREATALSRKASRYFPPWKVVWEYGCDPIIPEKYKRLWRWTRGLSQSMTLPVSIINPSLAKRVGLLERAQALQAKQGLRVSSARQEHWQGLSSGLLPYVLEMADKAAAAFSVDPRYPFCDRRLVEFCLAVPANQKLHDGWTRMIMRRAMAGVLPNEVRWRTGKANLSPNFQLKLLHAHRELLDQVILNDPGVIEEYLDVRVLQKVYFRYLSQQSANDALVVYSAVTLALWLSAFRAAPLS